MKSMLTCILLMSTLSVQAESKKVQVFEQAQQYWDVKTGNTLGQICQQLSSDKKNSILTCQNQILKKNADAFINKNPDRLIAGQRLWLPGSYRPASKLDSNQYHIKKFNWGSIKTPK